MIRRSGCGLLLDVNNVYVSCINHQRDPLTYLDALPLHAVGEIHLAGFAEDADSLGDRLLIDDHGAPIDQAVWGLYRQVLQRIGPVATLIERDNQVPAFAVLLANAVIGNGADDRATNPLLRWAAPVDPQPWKAPRLTQQFGNACVQYGRIYGPGTNNRYDTTIGTTLGR